MSVRRILVGVDESEGSCAALAWATELAQDLGARLVLLHVFEPLAHLAELAPGSDLRAARDRAAAALRGPMCAGVRRRERPVRQRAAARAHRVRGASMTRVGMFTYSNRTGSPRRAS